MTGFGPSRLADGRRIAALPVTERVSAARSQPYYVDVIHPEANKGGVVAFLAQALRHRP